jgi:hypothetical protein
MRIGSRLLVAATLVAAVGCGGKLPGGHALPGGNNLPSNPVPAGLGGSSGEVDPNTCGNYAVTDAGRKLHDFLVATKEVAKTAEETAKVVKQSCVMMGHELGMTDADFNGMETKDVCAKVWGTIHDNMKVAFKAKAGLKIKYKPAVCKVDVDAEAKAAAKCEGKASADIGATCSGVCHGSCDGKCSGHAGTGGSGGAGECKAAAAVNASIHAECTEPQLTIDADAKVVLDKSKLETTLKAARNGLPKLLSVAARIKPIQDAVAVWAKTASDLKDMGPKFAQSFADQAMCITGQIAAAANAASHIHAEVSVSVQVSASASGSVGG